MKHLKIRIEAAQEAYKNGNDEIKKFLINLHGKEHFITDVKERVTDYASACKELNILQVTIEQFGFMGDDAKRYYARYQLTIIVRALIGDWKPDWKNYSEYKYYNYFYWDKDKKCFSSSSSYFYDLCDSGSDLYFPTRELADYARVKFAQLYIDYLF